jgi:hypothetical protein
MSFVRERFNPKPMAVNASEQIRGIYLGGFLAKTTGTITIVGKNSTGETDVTYVDAVPVTAGVYTPIPITLPTPEFTVTLLGGASGTLMV